MELNQAIGSFNQKKILVLGDYCIDEFLYGEANSISPESPIIRAVVGEVKANPGMTGNLASNLSSLGAQTYAAGVIGKDESSRQLTDEFHKRGINTEGLVLQDSRLTSKFSRIVLGGSRYPAQPAIRFDFENKDPVNSGSLKKIVEFIDRIKGELDAIIIADYDEVGMGVINSYILKEIVRISRENNIFLIGDSRKNFALFHDFDCIVPNVVEAERLYGEERASLEQITSSLLERLNLNAILITRDKEGMNITPKGEETIKIAALAKKVVDVTGAGDTTTAAFTLGLCSGLGYGESAQLASCAAAIAVSKPGVASVTLDELRGFRI